MDESEKIKFSEIELEEAKFIERVRPLNVSLETGECRDQPLVRESRSGTEPAPPDHEMLDEIERVEAEEEAE